MKVKIIVAPKDIWHGESVMTFDCDTLEMAQGIVKSMLEKEVAVINAVVYDVIDLSFTAHDDATSHGCQMCGNEWKSLNKQGFCSSCWTVWNS